MRYIHGDTSLETSDIYDDAALTNRVFAGLAFGEATGDIDTPVGEKPITFTAADNVGSILFETTLTSFFGTRLNIYMTQGTDGLIGQRVVVDRRSVETFARLSFFHSAANHASVDLYVVDSGQSIDDIRPARPAVTQGTPSGSIGRQLRYLHNYLGREDRARRADSLHRGTGGGVRGHPDRPHGPRPGRVQATPAALAGPVQAGGTRPSSQCGCAPGYEAIAAST